MNRTIWIIVLSSAFVLTFQSAGNAGIKRGPYLSSVTATSIVITWSTGNLSSGKVRYGKTITLDSNANVTELRMTHSVLLTGLQPSTVYHYRVISDGETTPDFTFITAAMPGEPIVFTVYGDTRSNRVAHVGVLRKMLLEKPRFIINSGDLVGKNTVTEWDNYFADVCKVTGVGSTIPMYASPGNHEHGAMYYSNLALPHNNPSNTEAYYSFRYGDVYVISINTEIPFSKSSPQYAWIASDLSSPEAVSAKFRIAFWHRPPYSSGAHGSDQPVRAILCPLMEANNVDIVFNGHDHTYERSIPMRNTTYVVSGGGAAPLYDFKSTNSWTAYREKAHHFCRISVDGNSLRMQMIRSDGAIRDSLVLNK